MKKSSNKPDFILIETRYWKGLYYKRRLLMQTEWSPNSLNEHRYDPTPLDYGPIKRIKCDYFGILPEDLDSVTVPVWKKNKIHYYRRVI